MRIINPATEEVIKDLIVACVVTLNMDANSTSATDCIAIEEVRAANDIILSLSAG
jgi:hypothetical protein